MEEKKTRDLLQELEEERAEVCPDCGQYFERVPAADRRCDHPRHVVREVMES